MQDVVLITGASSGIVAATAPLLVAAGAYVVVNYKSSRELAEGVAADVEAAGGKTMAVAADMGSEADILKLFEATDQAFGLLTGLVNNAGQFASKNPHGRAGRPEEVAEAIAWLLSDKASLVTGATLDVMGAQR